MQVLIRMKEQIREILETEIIILNPKEIALQINFKELVSKENVAFVELKVYIL